MFILKLLVLLIVAFLLNNKSNSLYLYSISKSTEKESLKKKVLSAVITILTLVGIVSLGMTLAAGIESISKNPHHSYNRWLLGDLLFYISIVICIYIVRIYIKGHVNKLQVKAYNAALADLSKQSKSLQTESDWDIIYSKLQKSEYESFNQ